MYSLNTDSALELSRTASHTLVTIIRLLQTFILLFILSPLAEEHSITGAQGFRTEQNKYLFLEMIDFVPSRNNASEMLMLCLVHVMKQVEIHVRRDGRVRCRRLQMKRSVISILNHS